MTALIAVTSGKTQVGKSLFSANLAHYLSSKSLPIGLVVAGGHESLWGVGPGKAWPKVQKSWQALDDMIVRDVFGIDILAIQSPSVPPPDRVPGIWVAAMAQGVAQEKPYAYLIAEMAAGLSAAAMACCLAATETILVLTAETTALTAAYEWLGQLKQCGFSGPVNVIFNQVRKPALAQTAYARFRDLAQKRLHIQTNLWGSIAWDQEVAQAGVQKQPLADMMPQSKALRDIQTIGDRLLAEQPPENQTLPLQSFWQRFVEHMAQLPALPDTAPQQAPAAPVIKEDAALPTEETQAIPLEDETVETRDKPGREGDSGLNRLAVHLETISQELSTIRRLLEDRQPTVEIASDPASGSVPAEETKVLLDFDGFVARHQGKEQ